MFMRQAIIWALLVAFVPRAAAIELPPVSAERQKTYEFYKLEFLPDGYPGRRLSHGLVPHPIYGAYVIGDYLSLFRGKGEARYLKAARTVADAALSRMTDLNDALVFYYTPEMKLTSLPGTFYSGLTQARYIRVFSALAKASGDEKYKVAAERALKSLAIPVSEGGVLRRSHGGAVIEEWPHQVMGDYTLNGWTTALVILARYANDTGSPAARELFDQNLISLKALLPLYDVPEFANSRYRLSGSAQLRLVVEGADAEFMEGSVIVPNEGSFPFEKDTKNVWHNHVKSQTKPRNILLNALLNYVSFPEENAVELVFNASDRGTVSVEILTGTYHPLKKLADKSWVQLGSFQIERGRNTVRTAIGWDAARASITPTDFNKKIHGDQYNVYHFMHVDNLERLWRLTREPMFKSYADKWEAAAATWPSLPVYRDAGVKLTRLGPKAADTEESEE